MKLLFVEDLDIEEAIERCLLHLAMPELLIKDNLTEEKKSVVTELMKEELAILIELRLRRRLHGPLDVSGVEVEVEVIRRSREPHMNFKQIETLIKERLGATSLAGAPGIATFDDGVIMTDENEITIVLKSTGTLFVRIVGKDMVVEGNIKARLGDPPRITRSRHLKLKAWATKIFGEGEVHDPKGFLGGPKKPMS